MDSKAKQKTDSVEIKDAEKMTGVSLPDDLNKLLKEYREVAGEMPRLQILKDIKRVDKSKDVVDKSRDVTLTADHLVEISSSDKSDREIAAAILTALLTLNRNYRVEDITASFKNMRDALEKADTKED